MPPRTENAWNRRVRRLLWLAGTASTIWFLSSYVMERMRDARVKAIKERKKRDLMKNHFTSLVSTISFTLYALLPTLQPQVFDAYPVEETSQALQGLSASNPASMTTSVGSIAPEAEADTSDATRTAGQSLLSDKGEAEAQTPTLSSVSQSQSSSTTDRQGNGQGAASATFGGESWASEFTASSPQAKNQEHGGDETASEAMVSSTEHIETDDGMSSIASASISLPPTDISSSPSPSPPSDNSQFHHSPISDREAQQPGEHSTKSKKELWSDLKIQSLTRTITTIYLLPMLYLLTSSQLAILARHRYLADIKSSLPVVPGEGSKDSDRSKADHSSETSQTTRPIKKGWFSSFSVDSMGLSEFVESSTAILPNPIAYLPTTVASYLPNALTSAPAQAAAARSEAITSQRASEELAAMRQAEEDAHRAEAERLFLTYSWWLLHEGWKGVSSRVESSVIKISGGMPLKKAFTTQDWEMRLKEVRAEVEMELSEKSTIELYDFTPHMLPLSCTHTEGIPFPLNPSDHSDYLSELFKESQDHLSSPDGRYLLEKGVSTLMGNLITSLNTECYAQAEGRRLVDCLAEISRWGKGVWEGVPDSGVEAMLAIPEYEGFAALVFGDWAPK
ncbi:hypothetical protein IAU60_002721 [Kwoniella sp. DSM 27419]